MCADMLSRQAPRSPGQLLQTGFYHLYMKTSNIANNQKAVVLWEFFVCLFLRKLTCEYQVFIAMSGV